MEINLHQLEIFVCIARERSFSKAAARLRISQPSVSIQIRNLEDSLDVKLFERLGRRVYLTPEGEAVLVHAKKIAEIVSTLQAEIRDIKGVRRGKLAAGCSRVPSATRVPRAVAQFKKQYPETEISIKTGRSNEVEQWVLDNEVDLGVIEGEPKSALLKNEPWYDDEIVLVLARGSPLLKQRNLTLSEILEQPFLLQAPGVRPTFIERVIKQRNMTIQNPVTVGSREAIKAAIVAGYGVALVPQSIIDTEVRAGLVKTRKVPELDARYPVNIVFRKDKRLSKSSEAFLEILRQQVSDRSARSADLAGAK
jgi:DNA-binding transcriptional LysR family regulator